MSILSPCENGRGTGSLGGSKEFLPRFLKWGLRWGEKPGQRTEVTNGIPLGAALIANYLVLVLAPIVCECWSEQVKQFSS